MAARRLIAILLALLVVSSFAAALAPQEGADQTDSTESESTTAPATSAAGDELGGALVERRIGPDPERPVALQLEQGDQLQLLVGVSRPAPVRIPALGESSFATPGTPARFDLLLREPGRYPVTVGDGTTVGRIEVGAG